MNACRGQARKSPRPVSSYLTHILTQRWRHIAQPGAKYPLLRYGAFVCYVSEMSQR